VNESGFAGWQRMLQCFWQQKLPTAFLLTPWQAELIDLVHAWEKLMLCQNPAQQGACGQCRSCYLYSTGNHPDCFSLHEDSKETGISIDDIRAIGNFASQATHQGGRRIITLSPVECLSLGAANALLKTLEEPASGTFFLLGAKQLSRVLPTVRSRCALIPVSYPVRAAQSLDRSQALLYQALFVDNAHAITSEKIQQFVTSKPHETLYLIYYWITDLIRCSVHEAPVCLYNQTESEQLQKCAQELGPTQALLFLDKVNKALQTITLPGINKGLLLETLLYGWHQNIRMAV
jgi:DNA polymerase-3 subunit delta'